MSFADLLRQARSNPTAAIHKFLTNYDPQQVRLYIFVEGEPDQAFYRKFIDPLLKQDQRLFVYNCEGKARVYDAYSKVVERYPRCRDVLFFVDKDIDDIVGHAWPADPRIFVTEYYSVENYLVYRDAVARYLYDFVKLKNFSVDFNAILEHFEKSLNRFYRAMVPVMALIVIARRSGLRPLLTDVRVSKICTCDGNRVGKNPRTSRLDYLTHATGIRATPGRWRQIRQVSRELLRLPPKSFIRGKFEASFAVAYVKRMLDELSSMARASGGSISISTQLNENNFVQLFVHGVAAPTRIELFLRFHLTPQDHGSSEQRNESIRLRAMRWILKILRVG